MHMKEYTCPNCHTHDFSYSSVAMDKIVCMDCGGYWTEKQLTVKPRKHKQKILGHGYSCKKSYYVYKDPSQGVDYVVRFDDLESVIGVGETKAEAIKEAKILLKQYLDYCKDNHVKPE